MLIPPTCGLAVAIAILRLSMPIRLVQPGGQLHAEVLGPGLYAINGLGMHAVADEELILGLEKPTALFYGVAQEDLSAHMLVDTRHINLYVYVHKYVYIYIYICVCEIYIYICT